LWAQNRRKKKFQRGMRSHRRAVDQKGSREKAKENWKNGISRKKKGEVRERLYLNVIHREDPKEASMIRGRRGIVKAGKKNRKEKWDETAQKCGVGAWGEMIHDRGKVKKVE